MGDGTQHTGEVVEFFSCLFFPRGLTWAPLETGGDMPGEVFPGRAPPLPCEIFFYFNLFLIIILEINSTKPFFSTTIHLA
jgi:hypothetical protein